MPISCFSSSCLASSLISHFFLFPDLFHLFFFTSSFDFFILKGLGPLAFLLLIPITNNSLTSSHFFFKSSLSSVYFSIAISAQCFFKNYQSCTVMIFYDCRIIAFCFSTSLGASITSIPLVMKITGQGIPSHK